jgi:hypothetical protein
MLILTNAALLLTLGLGAGVATGRPELTPKRV